MAELEEQVPNWAYHATRVFQKSHGRRLYLIPEQPFYHIHEPTSHLDPNNDTIAIDQGIQILHNASKWWEEEDQA
jgi:hypothetical protein